MPQAKPVVLYTLASAGMGHATRAVPMLERLARTYEVHVFCGGPAYKWLKKKVPQVELHWIKRFEPVFVGDRVSLPLVYGKALALLPLSLFSIGKIASMLVSKRPVAIVTDFELHGTWAALLTRPLRHTKIVEFDNFSAMRWSEPPFPMTDDEEKRLSAWRSTVRVVVPHADECLVQAVVRSPLVSGHARHVPPPIRDEFKNYPGEIRHDGPIVVSLGARKMPSLPKILEETGLAITVFGWPEAKTVGKVQFVPFSETAYVDALARAPFVIVSANSSALDALALKKPVLVTPIPGQLEQWYSARLLETLGVAKVASTLTAKSIVDFADDLEECSKNARSLTLFDNDATFAELERAIQA